MVVQFFFVGSFPVMFVRLIARKSFCIGVGIHVKGAIVNWFPGTSLVEMWRTLKGIPHIKNFPPYWWIHVILSVFEFVTRNHEIVAEISFRRWPHNCWISMFSPLKSLIYPCYGSKLVVDANAISLIMGLKRIRMRILLVLYIHWCMPFLKQVIDKNKRPMFHIAHLSSCISPCKRFNLNEAHNLAMQSRV